MRVHRHADETPGHLAHVRHPGREKRGVRTAVSHRDAESLRAADHDVRAEFAWRCDQRQREQIGRDRDQHSASCARVMNDVSS